MSVRKIGVEEELMLVDPRTRTLRPASSAAVSANQAGVEVAEELFLQQVETSTRPRVARDDLLADLRAGRRALGEAAGAAGVRAVAMPAPVLAQADDEHAITRRPRYLRIGTEYGELARQALVSAMHLHVDVASEQEAVRVVDGIRPWLPLLIALGANSPFWRGRDTGHASWRSQVWSRWPTAMPAQPFGDVETYRVVSRRIIDWGGGIDEAMLYFDARLASRYPTVEIRVADVCTDLEDAVLVALLARALVETAATAEPSAPPWRADLLRVAGWRAARHGLAADLVHPVRLELAPPREVFAAAVEHARAALEESGDLSFVQEAFGRLVARGNGATRQRRCFEATGSLERVVDDLADRTESSWS